MDPGLYAISLIVMTDDGRVSLRTRKSVVVTCSSGDTTPWTSTNIGEAAFPGAARRETTDEGEGFRICAGGNGIRTGGDELFFLYQEFEGDFRIAAEIPVLPAESDALAGVMFRQSLEVEAPFAATFLEARGTNRFRLRYRDQAYGRVRSQRGETFETGGWVRIERRGNVFLSESSLDGVNWTLVREEEIEGVSRTMLAGLAVASIDNRGNPVQIRVTKIETTRLGSAPRFVRGDANGDGKLNIADAGYLLNWLFPGGPGLPCSAASNTNGADLVDISDASYLLSFLFAGGPSPVAPFPDCGPGMLTVDEELGCANPPNCQ